MYATRPIIGKRTFFYFFAFSVYDFDGWYTSSDFDENSKLAGIHQGEKAPKNAKIMVYKKRLIDHHTCVCTTKSRFLGCFQECVGR